VTDSGRKEIAMRALGDLAATDFAAAGSPEGKAWMAALPSLLRDLARQWNLTTAGDLLGHGYNAVVLPVSQGGRPLALKLTWPPERARKEADALAAWRAQGAVELAACDAPRGALLLERLDASRSLASIPVGEAAAVAGALIRTLAVAPSGSFPSLRAQARQLAATIPARQRALQDLAGPGDGLVQHPPQRLLPQRDVAAGQQPLDAAPGQRLGTVAVLPAPLALAGLLPAIRAARLSPTQALLTV
jgi:hypothetical protein